MVSDKNGNGVASGRLDHKTLLHNFSDLHPAYSQHQALVAADRCYFCFDAPCVTACPTDIDIPLFIREISTGATEAAAKTIFDQNILGGMCARVCPTETLCEQACVREKAEGKPVEIGRLQRHATDQLMARGSHPFQRAKTTGKHVAIVGAGPAGLACAHRLALYGHHVTIYESRQKGGGLNEFGIASYKTVDNFAQKELDWLLSIGGIEIKFGADLGSDLTLEMLRSTHDAVFLAMGLSGVNALGLENENLENVEDAVAFIGDLRQAKDLGQLPIGRQVVVIGGGMTAVDAAVQSKLLGADEVSIVYRRGKDAMSASLYEQDLATSKGVRLYFNAQPVALEGQDKVEAVVFERTVTKNGKLSQTGERFSLAADQVFKAIGQKLGVASWALALERGKIKTGPNGQTNVSGIWAGGDCATGGDDLTVTAVAQGRDAAEAMHVVLRR